MGGGVSRKKAASEAGEQQGLKAPERESSADSDSVSSGSVPLRASVAAEFALESGKGFGLVSASGKGFGLQSGKGFGLQSGKGFGLQSGKGFGLQSGKGFGLRSGKGWTPIGPQSGDMTERDGKASLVRGSTEKGLQISAMQPGGRRFSKKERRTMSSMRPNELHTCGLTMEEFLHYQQVIAASEQRILPWTITEEADGQRQAVKPARHSSSEEVGDQPKSEETTKLLIAALNTVPALFAEVPAKLRYICVNAMREQRFSCGQTILRQGEDGTNMYIIAEGTCDVLIEKKPDIDDAGDASDASLTAKRSSVQVKVATLTVGAVIGELAALYRHTRTASVVVASDTCVCYTLSQAAYQWICFRGAAEATQDTLAQLRRVPMLAWLRNSERVQVGQLFSRNKEDGVKPGRICLDVDAGVFYFNTPDATVQAMIERVFRVAKRLHGLFARDESSSTVKATSAVQAEHVETAAGGAGTLLTCAAADFAKSMANFLPETNADEQSETWLVRQLIHLDLFTGSEQLSHAKWLLGESRRRVLPVGATFSNEVEGAPDKCENSILIAGVVSSESKSGGVAKRYYSGCSVLAKSRSRSFRCETTCYLLVFDADKAAGWCGQTRDKLEQIEWCRVIVHEVIGLGSFGKVMRAEVVSCAAESKSRFFALKQLNKACITSKSQAESLFAERNILATCAHPLVTRLVATFNVGGSLYLLMELLEGGALWSRLKKSTSLCLRDATYYSGCVLLALRFLHHNCIVFRDVKPENVALSLSGLPKLIDFGFAKTVVERTYTLCGTPDYMAPEVLQNKGHDQAVDLWAVGVLIFDMLYGKTPFGAGGNEAKLFFNIINKPIRVPDAGPAFEPAKDLIEHLCDKNPFRRSGWDTGDADDVLRHPFFADLPLVKMAACKSEAELTKLVPPPWRPTRKAMRKVDPQRIHKHDAKAIVAARSMRSVPEAFWADW